MGILLLGDAPLLSGTIELPLLGAWTADLEVDADNVPSGQLKISGAGLSLVGTVVNALSWNDRQRARLVGGAAGMGKVLPARWYSSTTLRTVAIDILTAAGERLAATSDASILGRSLSCWARSAGTAGGLLRYLLAIASPGTIWRTLRDGSIWIGVPSWPTVTTTALVMDNRGDEDAADLAGEDLSLDAGVVALGRQVGFVRHNIRAESLRTEAWWSSVV